MIPKAFETISEYVCKQTRWTDGSIRHDRMEDVVRCKDCVVFGTHGKNTDICPMWHNTHIDPYRDFCSRGVRKTENSSETPNNSKVSEKPTGSEKPNNSTISKMEQVGTTEDCSTVKERSSE